MFDLRNPNSGSVVHLSEAVLASRARHPPKTRLMRLPQPLQKAQESAAAASRSNKEAAQKAAGEARAAIQKVASAAKDAHDAAQAAWEKDMADSKAK